MALNSNIRNIPLQANCDLAQFGADLHDYKEFSTCNSLFMNKRLNSWKRRATSDSEVTADIHYETDGEDFVLLNSNNSELGRVKREYTKLETIEKGDVPEGLNKVVNPINKKMVAHRGGIELGDVDKVFERYLDNGYTISMRLDGIIYLFDENDNLLKSYDVSDNFKSSYGIPVFASSLYNEYESEIVVDNSNYFYIPNNSIYIDYLYDVQGYKDFIAKESFCITIDDLEIHTSIKKEGRYGNPTFKTVFVNDKKLSYFQVGGMGSDKNWDYIPDIHNKAVYYGSEYCAIQFIYDSYESNKVVTISLYPTYSSGSIWKIGEYTLGVLSLLKKQSNYSKKYGKWAVNFINGTPENIAYNYHKLFYLNGNQDTEGVCTDIDGYNDDYIYFHTQDSYYRISIAQAEDINDILVNVTDYYLIFKTTTYLNAYYITGKSWFCSCDDWNSRAQWAIKEYSNYWYLLASRCGKPSWLTDTDTTTVSAQYPSMPQRYVLKNKTVEAYGSSEIWNGTDYVYDANGNQINTSSWSRGHSLAGYYYISSFESDPSKMDVFWVDVSYTAPEYDYYNLSSKQWEKKKQKYTVYFGDMSSQVQSLQKQGYITCDGWTIEPDETEIYAEPTSATEYQDNPPLLDTKYIVFTQTILADTSHLIYTLLTSATRRFWLMYKTVEESEVHEGDREFVINGSLYVYQSSQNRILDSNGQWVCNAELFKYIGFSSRYAYFYCEFDKGIYIFSGDNTMTKLTTIEKYQVLFQGSTEDTAITVDSLNLPAIDLVLFNLDDAVGILYGEQFAILQTGTINSWSMNIVYGTFIVNGYMYSLNKYNLEKGNVEHFPISNVPIQIETEYYGAVGTENNMINDCVYLMLSNLNGVSEGDLKIRIKALVNNKTFESKEKVFHLKANDFSKSDCCGIKYQPEVQECYGFKVIIQSDFEISELKIGTSQGAMNQSRFRF